MRTGKLAEPVRKRSVLRQLNKDKIRAEKLYGTDCIAAGMHGERAAAGSNQDLEVTFGQMVVAAPDMVPGSEDRPQRMVTAAVNSLLAAGAEPQVLLVQGFLPETYEEADLQRDMKQIASAAREVDWTLEKETSGQSAQGQREAPSCERTDSRLQVMAGQLEVSASVLKPHYMINGIGWRAGEKRLFRPGQELVLTKWIALGGTAALAEKFEEKLHGRYPFSLIDRAKEFERLTSAARDARAITHFGASPMHALGQGGIFGALWELAEHAGVGLEVDLKKIPVKQETIEICEFFDINPYGLYSAGSLLVGTDRAEALAAELADWGIPASVIGRVTGSNDRVIRNGGDCRFLDRPGQEEWYRRIQNK